MNKNVWKTTMCEKTFSSPVENARSGDFKQSYHA